MHTPRRLHRTVLLCLAAAALTGCGSRQDSYTPDQQKQMKSGQAAADHGRPARRRWKRPCARIWEARRLSPQLGENGGCVERPMKTSALDTTAGMCHYLVMPTPSRGPAETGQQRPRSPRQPNSADVAVRAGVSRSTVSVVLNGHHKPVIAEATRERVLQAARDLNYRPNQLARALITGVIPPDRTVDVVPAVALRRQHHPDRAGPSPGGRLPGAPLRDDPGPRDGDAPGPEPLAHRRDHHRDQARVYRAVPGGTPRPPRRS